MRSFLKSLAILLCLCLTMSLLAACGDKPNDKPLDTRPAFQLPTASAKDPATEPETEPETEPTAEAATEPETEAPTEAETEPDVTLELSPYDIGGHGCVYLEPGMEDLGLDNFDIGLAGQRYLFVATRDGRETLEELDIEFPEDLTAYSEIVSEINELPDDFYIDDYGNVFTTYIVENGDVTYSYYLVVVAAEDAYWTVNFCCMDQDSEALFDEFCYLASVMDLH